jgi:predicted hydrolase (HD superfamily)
MQEWTAGESLRKHCLSVSICCEAYGRLEAQRLGMEGTAADELVDQYACAGLLHDFDYEKHPSAEEHPFVGVKYLREHGWDEAILQAILAHADYSGVKPETAIADVEVKGVLKKMKDKAFARAVKREDMTHGAELLGVPLEEHAGVCLGAMQARAAELGL